jgi:hypothetical protein
MKSEIARESQETAFKSLVCFENFQNEDFVTGLLERGTDVAHTFRKDLNTEMGCVCSKKKPLPKDRSQPDHDEYSSNNRETEVPNVLHQNGSPRAQTSSMVALSSIAQRFHTNKLESHSLFHSPTADQLLKRCWINKRGHLVRTWKKRYCVLDKNDLNYYVQPSNEPPYGKKRKGKIALLGAVCVDKESEDGLQIEVEIYGNVGEKDLFFWVDNNKDGQVCDSFSFIQFLSDFLYYRNLFVCCIGQ